MIKYKGMDLEVPYSDWEESRNLAELYDSETDRTTCLVLALTGNKTRRYKTELNDKQYYQNIGQPKYWENDFFQCSSLYVPDIRKTPLLTLTEARQCATVKYAYFYKVVHEKAVRMMAYETGIDIAPLCKLYQSVENSCDITERHIVCDAEDRNWWNTGNLKRLDIPNTIKPFSFHLDAIPVVAEYICGQSCHELLFGETGRIRLPKIYSSLIIAIEAISMYRRELYNGLKKECDKISKRLIEEKMEKNDARLPLYGQYRDTREVIRERMQELASDVEDVDYRKGIFTKEKLGPLEFTSIIQRILNSEPETEKVWEGRKPHRFKNVEYEPAVESVMMISLLSGQSMDYFIRNDFVNVKGGASMNGIRENHKISYYNPFADQYVELDNRDVLTLLSYIVSLPQKEKWDIWGRILAEGNLPPFEDSAFFYRMQA